MRNIITEFDQKNIKILQKNSLPRGGFSSFGLVILEMDLEAELCETISFNLN